jgi:hypothetical protein
MPILFDDRCVAYLQHGKNVVQSLTMLQQIINTYPQVCTLNTIIGTPECHSTP